MIFSTIGNLISPQTFKVLKRKYIKNEFKKINITQKDINLIKSMKNIRDNISKKNTLIKNRNDRDKYSSQLINDQKENYKSLKRLLKSSLKVPDPLSRR